MIFYVESKPAEHSTVVHAIHCYVYTVLRVRIEKLRVLNPFAIQLRGMRRKVHLFYVQL